MKDQLMYVERKRGHNHDDLAWIGRVKFSRTGRTAYFNGQSFKHLGKGDYFEPESGDAYWISGIKKNGEDRHWAGHGKIMIDKEVVTEYLQHIQTDKLNPNKFEIVEIQPTDIQLFNELENEKL